MRIMCLQLLQGFLLLTPLFSFLFQKLHNQRILAPILSWLCHYGIEVVYYLCSRTVCFLCSRTENRLTYRECVHRIYQQGGFRGFYKGLTASYYGVSETVLHLVVYEAVKAHLMQASVSASSTDSQNNMQTMDFFKFMLAGAISKSFATCLAYPHGEYCLPFPLCMLLYPLIFSSVG